MCKIKRTLAHYKNNYYNNNYYDNNNMTVLVQCFNPFK